MNHFQHFFDFCMYERLTGGPDPHMQAVVEMSRDCDFVEKVWRSMLYVGFYNVPSAEAMWTHVFPENHEDPKSTEEWLKEYWPGLRTRRERRTVKSPERMSDYLWGFKNVVRELQTLKDAEFEEVWDFAKDMHHVGRYAATKLCEIWHRMDLISAECPDIRADGGWSPREALNLIYDRNDDCRLNSHAAIKNAEELAADNYKKIREHGLQISRFEQEVMLCEYKESYKTHRQYPGRSLDSELGYEMEIAGWWGTKSDFKSQHLEVRKIVSPSWALGELNGWDGVRKDLGYVLYNYGYTWSDAIYDFKATTNLKNPVRRPCPLA